MRFGKLLCIAALAAPLVAHATPTPGQDPKRDVDPTDPKKPPPPPLPPDLSAPVLPPHGPTVPAFTLSPRRPRLVVLMHGVTPKISEDPRVDSSLHARHYWGYQLIQGLMGTVGEGTFRVITPKMTGDLHITTNKGQEWIPVGYRERVRADLAPIVIPQTALADGLFKQIENNSKEIRTVIGLLTKAASEPPTAVMVTFRDGSKHLMPQTGEAIDQIYASYILAYGHLKEEHQPQLYLVGHSFGGVVARAILANPEGADLFGNKLTAEQRWRADFIRSRVVHVTTLAAPHLGTPMGIVAQDFARVVKAVGAASLAVAKQSELLDKLDIKDSVLQTILDTTKSALAAVSGTRDCHDDLTRMAEYNAGILKPETAVRGPGSTAKVPIYTIGARSPSGLNFALDRAPPFIALKGAVDRPYDVIDLIKGPEKDYGGENSYDIRRAHEGIALYAIQGVLHIYGYGRAAGSPWGKAAIPEADMVKSPWAKKGLDPLRKPGQTMIFDKNHLGPVLYGLIAGAPYERGQDGDNDSDGFLGWDSAQALGLPGDHWYRIYDRTKYGTWQPWDNDHHGSIMFNVGVGVYLHNEMLRKAGPNVVAGSRLSLWDKQPAALPEKHTVTVELAEIRDLENSLDPGSKADFQVTVYIADQFNKTKMVLDTQSVKSFGSFTNNNVASSVVPIRIDVNEIDDNPDPDDNCVITRRWGREQLILYFDTRTGKIYGDEIVPANTYFEVSGNKGHENRAFIRLKVTGK